MTPSRLPTAFLALGLVSGALVSPAFAQSGQEASVPAPLEKLVPEFEAYLQNGMKAFDIPGVAVGIVQGDKLIYSRGFGVKEHGTSGTVTPETIFQIGSTTKAFLSVTLAQAVDAGKLTWNDKVEDLAPEFQLSDPWISRDFRMLDLAAQRSGLTPYVNDGLAMLGFDQDTLIRSLKTAPVTGTFRSDFRYLNIPHVVAGQILAEKEGVPSWNDVVKENVLTPLRMSATTATPEGIAQASDHATGHRATAKGPVAVPFHYAFPYSLGPAGNLNSNVPDMSQWLRMQLGRGQFEDKIIVSEENLDVTWTPRVAVTERASYAIGWVVSSTPNGRIIWHNGGTTGFGAHVGFLPDRDIGVVIVSNAENRGFPDAVAHWFYDRILGNPRVDNVAVALEALRAKRVGAEQVAAAIPIAAASAPEKAPYEGTYTSSILGEAVVTATDGGLELKLERTEAVLALTPSRQDQDTYVARLKPMGAFVPVAAMTGDDPITEVRFERGQDGAVSRMEWVEPTLPHIFERQR